MSQFLEMFVIGIMDSFEGFFDSVTLPTSKYVTGAFKVSLVFLIGSIAAEYFNIWCFVSWQEALTCSLLLLMITLIDSGVRSSIKGNLSKLKEIASKQVYTGDVDEGEGDAELQPDEIISSTNTNIGHEGDV